jgi:hypothetical protein
VSDFLSTLSTEDLQALHAGDLSKMSTSGLQLLNREQMKRQMNLDPTADMSTTDKVLAGAGAGMTSALRAVGLNKVAGYFGAPDTKEEADALDAPLEATTAGKVGRAGGIAAAALPAALVPGANTYLGATALGALTGGALTEGDLDERLRSAAYGAVGGLAGKAVGDAAGSGAGATMNWLKNRGAQAAAQNAQKDAAAAAARDAGFVFPPNETNPTVLNEALTGLSGKVKTGQVASARNQTVTDALGREALGLKPGDELTADVLQGIRSTAAQTGYAPVRNSGMVVAGPEYANDLNRIAATSQGAARSFPGLKDNGIQDLVTTLKQDMFDAGDAVDATKMLRQSADKAYRSGDAALGKAYKQAANAVEDELDRHLTSVGQPAALQAFRDARKLIAKTYSVQGALNDVTGQVSAPRLATQLTKGKPLSGELLTIAQAAKQFEPAMQSLKQAPGAVSPLDWLAQLAVSAHDLKNPIKWPVLLARPAVRSAILSKPYQALMTTPSYGPGALARTMLPAIGSDVTQRGMVPAGIGGALEAAYESQN